MMRSSGVSGPAKSAVVIRTNRPAFQILLAKLRLPSMRLGDNLMSLPGVELVVSVKRSASAPY